MLNIAQTQQRLNSEGTNLSQPSGRRIFRSCRLAIDFRLNGLYNVFAERLARPDRRLSHDVPIRSRMRLSLIHGPAPKNMDSCAAIYILCLHHRHGCSYKRPRVSIWC